MVNGASISGYCGYKRLGAAVVVLSALLLWLLLTPTLRSIHRRANHNPLQAIMSGASTGRSSAAEHRSSSSSSAAHHVGITRLYPESLPPSSSLQPTAPRRYRGGEAPKLATTFTTRSVHGSTVSNATLASTDNYYRAPVVRTTVADVTLRHIDSTVDGGHSVKQFVVGRTKSTAHPPVADAIATAFAANAFAQAKTEAPSVATALAPMRQPSTSTSFSIERAGHEAPVAKVTSTKLKSKTTTKNAGRATLEPAAWTIVAEETTKADDAPTVYIGLEKAGARFGNRMFQYASGLALALRYGRRAVLVLPSKAAVSSLDDLLRLFRLSPLPTLFARPPSSLARTLVESGWGRYDAVRFDNASTFERSVYTIGYFQSWKYFAPVADRVRREFALTTDAQQAADSYFRSVGLPLRSEGSRGGGDEALPVRVGVHVRRGDMLRQSNLYGVAPAKYLLKAIAYYRDKYSAPRYNVSFIFATDDRAWVRDNVTSHLQPDVVILYVSLDVRGDMAVLSRCDHSIITSGTFGWWSAWLAGGDVVYYRDFIRPTSDLYARYSAGDYYPPEWIGLTG